MADEPPPRPPPHGQNPRPPGGLPDGNYDIFIIPPHSAGGGFLYLPSLQPHRNSFLAGVAATLFAVGVWTLVMPVLKQWLGTLMQSGGVGVVVLVLGVGVAGWAWGKTQGEQDRGPGPGGGSASSSHSGQQQHSTGGAQANGFPPPPRPEPQPNNYAPPPPPPPPQAEPEPPPKPQPKPQSNAQSGWEKAREETKKREEERKRAEELRKKREEVQRLREEAERAAKAKAEKEKWEQARAREKEQREREARERIARERLAREKEAREKDTREREARENAEKDKADALKAAKERLEAAKAARASSPSKSYQKPSAKSYVGTADEEATSYRPYDTAPSAKSRPTYKSSASSVSGLSESSYAPSQSTARTTPPPSHRGPYSTKDPDKIQIKAVYLFSDSFPNKPISQLVSNEGSVTDGLILRIKTEGLFIDDDVRGVPQREWDVKAWTLKLVEDGAMKGASGGLHVFRATARDAENKKYTFVLDETEAWKVAIGLQKLKKGSQVRSLNMSGMKEAEVKSLLSGLGWA